MRSPPKQDSVPAPSVPALAFRPLFYRCRPSGLSYSIKSAETAQNCRWGPQFFSSSPHAGQRAQSPLSNSARYPAVRLRSPLGAALVAGKVFDIECIEDARRAASSAPPQKLAARRASSIPSTTKTLPSTSAAPSGEWSPPAEQRAEFKSRDCALLTQCVESHLGWGPQRQFRAVSADFIEHEGPEGRPTRAPA